MTDLTTQEWTALTYIQQYTGSKSIAPKSSDIGGAFGWSKSETKHTLNELGEKGVVVGRMTGGGVLRWHVLRGGMVGVMP
jgi:DNA-binding MarR family transcriptional regulator